MGPYGSILAHKKSHITSNSRPWRSIGSFMYIGSAGPGPGGRTDGRTVTDGGRTGGRTEGGRAGGRDEGRTEKRTEGGRRTDGRAGVRDDFERQYNDFHRFSQKTSKHIVFFCRFASGGSASTDFYSSNEKGVQKVSTIHMVF